MKKSLLLAGLLALLLLLAAVSDCVIGYKIRQELLTSSNALLEGYPSASISTQENRGWLWRSHIQQLLSLPAPKALNGKLGETLTFTITHFIEHGPFIIRTNGIKPIFGRVITKVALPDSVNSLFNYYRTQSPDISIISQMGLDRILKSELTISAVEFTGADSQLSWDGLRASISYMCKQDKLNAAIEWGHFYSEDSLFKAEISPIFFTSQGQVKSFTGNRRIAVELASFMLEELDAASRSHLSNIHAHIHYQESAAGVSRVEVKGELGIAEIAQKRYEALDFSIALEKLDTAILHQLNRAIDSSLASAKQDNLPPELIQIGIQSLLLQSLPKLLQSHPQLIAQFQMQYPQGPAAAKVEINFTLPDPPPLHDPIALLEKLGFKAHFDLPQEVFEQILLRQAKNQTLNDLMRQAGDNQPDADYIEPEPTLTAEQQQAVASRAAAHFEMLRQNRYVIVRDKQVTSHAVLDDGVMLINNRRIALATLLAPLFSGLAQ